jgi:ATPase family associated with various cellular activities (AAA)
MPELTRPLIPNIRTNCEGWNYAARAHQIEEFFKHSAGNEIIAYQITLDCKDSMAVLYSTIKNIVNSHYNMVHGSFLDSSEFYIRAGSQILLIASVASYRMTESGINSLNIDIYGTGEDAEKLKNTIKNELSNKKVVKISWYYKGTHRIEHSSMHVTSMNQKIHDEFYPWLPHGIDAFIRDYMNSPSSVMVLYGPPGTGKTSFLRHLLLTCDLNSMVTYDDSILREDYFFVNFLTDEDHNGLIVEDADLFLTSREDSRNDVMSKFLNVSEGLVKMPNKKMIFTTNISQLNKIDSALVRPGRCFAAIEFRELTPEEAKVAARVAGMPDRDWSSQKRWSLAQVFDNKSQDVKAPTKFKIGFT